MDGSAIFSRLSTDTNISALVGNRIYPQYVREVDKVYPELIYKVEQDTADLCYDGPTGLQTCTLNVYVIGNPRQIVEPVANAVLTSLNGSLGQWGTHTYVQGCFIKDDGISDDIDTEQVDETIIAYIKELAFEVKYNLTQTG
jgi:hypothetical protein